MNNPSGHTVPDAFAQGASGMRHRISGLGMVLATAIVLVLSLQATLLFASRPMTIAYPEYRPFFYTDCDNGIQGFFYEIIQEAVTRRMGVPLRWRSYPWSRCQILVKNGRADAMITVPTVGRASYCVTHEQPFYVKPLVLFTYADHPRMDEIMALRNARDIKKADFSVVTYSGNGWNKQIIQSMGIPVVETPLLPSVWQMLAGQRADLAIEWPTSAWPDIIAQGVQKNIVETNVAISGMPFHLLVGDHSPHAGILPRFDSVIREMREDGTITKILMRYGIKQ